LGWAILFLKGNLIFVILFRYIEKDFKSHYGKITPRQQANVVIKINIMYNNHSISLFTSLIF